MSYNIAESATLTTAASNYLIASDAYVTDPDYKILTMSGAAVFSDMNVVSGGTARLGGGAILSGATISAGGSLYFTNNASAIGLTVKSGGSAGGAAWAQNYEALTLESGAKLSVAAGSFRGRNNDIKAGTLTGAASVASDSVDGVLYGVTQTGAAINFYDIVLSNYNVGGFAYLCTGASAYNVTAGTANRGVGIVGGYLCNAKITTGKLWLHGQDTNTVIALGGAATTITRGHVYHCVADGTANNDTDLYAADGVLYGVTIKNSGTWLRNLHIREGLNISAPIVSSGGSLTIESGGIGTNVTVNTYGQMYVYDGTVNGLTVDTENVTGRRVYLYSGARVNDLAITGEKVDGQYIVNVSSGAVVSRASQNGGGLWVYNSAAVYDLQLAKGEVVFQDQGTYLSGAKVSGGSLYIRTGALVEDLYMNGGSASFNNGTIRNATFVGAIGQLKCGANFRMESATFIDGAVLSATSGGSLNSATIGSHAVIQVSSGAEATNVVVSGNDWDGRLRIYDGGHVSGVTLLGTASDKNYISMYTGTGVLEDVTADKGGIYLASGGIIRNVTQRNGALVILRGENPYASGAVVSGGTIYFQNGAKGENIVVNGGGMNIHDDGYAATIKGSGARVSGADLVAGTINVSAGGKLFDLRASGGTVNVTSTANYSGAVLSGTTFTGGTLNVNAGAAAQATEIGEGAKATVAGTLEVKTSAWNVTVNQGGTLKAVEGDTLNDLDAKTGATVDYANGLKTSGAMIRGGNTNIAANTLVYQGNRLDATVADGVITNLGGNGKTYRMRVGDGITVRNAVLNNGDRLYAHEEALVQGGTINAGGNIGILGNAVGSGVTVYANYNIFDNGTAKDTTVGNGGSLRLNHTTAKAVGTTVKAGGTLRLVADNAGSIDDTTLQAGATLELYAGADTGDLITLDFTGTTGDQSVTINDLGLVGADTRIAVGGLTAGHTYGIATAGSTERYLNCYWKLYDNAVKAGERYTNAFTGMTYTFDAVGKSLTTEAFEVGAAKKTAGAITTADTELNTNDRAAKWDASTAYTGSVMLADSTLAGDAWLEIDGTDVASALYGASGDFANTVNLYAKSGTIRNLAAGAEAGGSVGAVKLTVDGAEFTGTAYAGGFGSVTGATETLVAQGTFAKDFYAGALANYAKTDELTDVGDVSLTVEGGSFAGNLYGASAVKMGTRSGEVAHTAGNVSITLAGGEATNAKFCLFGGGYATGSVASETAAYTVESVTIDITGGDWGAANGGRGIFGGIYASGVLARIWAEDETDTDVAISISGGTMGNVYGGGWAQKGGTSEVGGNVSITVTGGTVANIFGGGSHSTSGGATSVGSVDITVAGGNVTGAIYARGQLDGDVVTGEANVTFAGANDYACGVYGYSYVGAAEASDATLTFAGYTGEFSGALGGFDSIEFNDGTAMTLATAAANVANSAWKFDVAARDVALAGTAMLDWSAADFSGDTIALNLAAGSTAEWTLVDAAAATVYNEFDVLVNGVSQGTLALGEQLADGEFAGWGFTLEDSALKFKNLLA